MQPVLLSPLRWALLLALLAPAPAALAQGRSDKAKKHKDKSEHADERHDDGRYRGDDDRHDDRTEGRRVGAVDVPPGHRPARGECRLWYYDRPPGHQPAAEPCERFRRVRYDGAVVIDHTGRPISYRDRIDRPRRSRDGGWERETVGGVLGDILFPDRYPRFTDTYGLNASVLERVIGAAGTRRALLAGRTAGLGGPVTGRWVQAGVLELAVGGRPVVRYVDRDGDRRADEVLVRRTP